MLMISAVWQSMGVQALESNGETNMRGMFVVTASVTGYERPFRVLIDCGASLSELRTAAEHC